MIFFYNMDQNRVQSSYKTDAGEKVYYLNTLTGDNNFTVDVIAQLEGKTVQNLTINSLYTKPTSSSENIICVGNEIKNINEEILEL